MRSSGRSVDDIVAVQTGRKRRTAERKPSVIQPVKSPSREPEAMQRCALRKLNQLSLNREAAQQQKDRQDTRQGDTAGDDFERVSLPGAITTRPVGVSAESLKGWYAPQVSGISMKPATSESIARMINGGFMRHPGFANRLFRTGPKNVRNTMRKVYREVSRAPTRPAAQNHELPRAEAKDCQMIRSLL